MWVFFSIFPEGYFMYYWVSFAFFQNHAHSNLQKLRSCCFQKHVGEVSYICLPFWTSEYRKLKSCSSCKNECIFNDIFIQLKLWAHQANEKQFQRECFFITFCMNNFKCVPNWAHRVSWFISLLFITLPLDVSHNSTELKF